MAKGKTYSRVNGRNGENITLEGDDLKFHTRTNMEQMAKEAVVVMNVLNTEQAREVVNSSDKHVHGIWTEKMPSTSGKSMFLQVESRGNCWIMEITKNQVPNASSFVESILPRSEGDDELRIPNRVINTPLGALFTVLVPVCIMAAVFLVFNFQLPIPGLICAIAAIVMFLNIK